MVDKSLMMAAANIRRRNWIAPILDRLELYILLRTNREVLSSDAPGEHQELYIVNNELGNCSAQFLAAAVVKSGVNQPRKGVCSDHKHTFL